MKIQIIILALIMIATAGATEIYSGQSHTFQSEQFEYYDVVGNQSNIDGMEVNWENGNTTITFAETFQSDSFTIILFNEKEVVKEVEVQVGRRGGGGKRIIYRDRNVTEESSVTDDKEITINIDSIAEDIAEEFEEKKQDVILPIIIILGTLLVGLIIWWRLRI